MIIVNSYKKLCSIVEKLDNSLFESKKIPVVLHVVNKDKLDYMIEKHTKEWINGTKMYRSWNIGASYSKQNF